jgi:hypothetical protein
MYESTRLDEKNLSKKPLPTTSPARDLNTEPPEFKQGAHLTRPRCSVPNRVKTFVLSQLEQKFRPQKLIGRLEERNVAIGEIVWSSIIRPNHGPLLNSVAPD